MSGGQEVGSSNLPSPTEKEQVRGQKSPGTPRGFCFSGAFDNLTDNLSSGRPRTTGRRGPGSWPPPPAGCLRNEVAVDVLGFADRGVPEHLRDDVERHALGEEQSGRRVPELVGSELSDPGFVAQPGEAPAEVRLVERGTDLAREDEAGLVPQLAGLEQFLALAGGMSLERGHEAGREVQRPP